MAFRVPEQQRIRRGEMGSDSTFGRNGAFMIPSCIPGRVLMIVASDGSDWELAGLTGEPWEHVSVHVISGPKEFTPTWIEMCQVKTCFWEPEDTVVQFHPKESEYVNCHPHTLHLWKPHQTLIPLPARLAV
jgi:hypothetical protein